MDKSQATKNISTLSGGERSFSTVSFIMALWEAVESPFRCLDEFDVFMDLMNRKISMQLMLEEAKSQGRRQFIFFTPQNMRYYKFLSLMLLFIYLFYHYYYYFFY